MASWFEELFNFPESTGTPAAYAATRSAFSYDPLTGALSTPVGPSGHSASFPAGFFSTPTLAELRAAGRALLLATQTEGGGGGGSSTPTSTTLTFTHIATRDVLTLHVLHPGATFLAASGLNCLEFSSPRQAPQDGVTEYESDYTQGPACALACAPGTVVRNYFAGNSPAAQINLLDALLPELAQQCGGAPPFVVSHGYVSAPRGAAGLAAADAALAPGSPLREHLRDACRVGVQADTCVTFAARWARCAEPLPRVTQVYAAALSLGIYKAPSNVPDSAWAPAATLVLEAAYEGALWAAVGAAARPGGSGKVFLCGLGLGVFGNELRWVVGAIGRAVRRLRAEGARLDVFFVHFREVDGGLASALNEAAAEGGFECVAAGAIKTA